MKTTIDKLLIKIRKGKIIFIFMLSVVIGLQFIDTEDRFDKTESFNQELIIENSQMKVNKVNIKDLILNIRNAYYELISGYKKDAIALKIADSEILLESIDAAKFVLEESMKQILISDHELDIIVDVELNKVKSINFTANTLSNDACEAELESVSIVEEVEFVEVFADIDEIQSNESAIDYITKLKDEPQTYTVKSGDVPSIIAEKNNMSLESLYELNSELESNSRKMQIGQKLTTTVLVPELSLYVTEMEIYQSAIAKDYTKIYDSDYYLGTNKTVKFGSDGLKEITASITKTNGVETSRKIIDEIVVQEPVNATIAIGSKALPPKGMIGTFISPLVDYTLSSAFGPRWDSQHRGIDMAANYGSSVRASDGGIIVYSGWKGSYGYLIEIDHGDGVTTRYAHNSKLLVNVGDTVSQYQEIAKVGSTGNSTGPHVHFEVLIDSIVVNPLSYIE